MTTIDLKGQGARHIFVLLLMLAAVLCIAARVAYVHIERSDFLKREGERHYQRDILQPAVRGRILDRNGHVLAVTVPAFSISAGPAALLQDLDELAALSKVLGLDAAVLERRARRALADKREEMYIKRQVKPQIAEAVKQADIKAVRIKPERKRVYPQGEMFAQVIGVTDIYAGHGLEGAELAFDEQLLGEDGIRHVIRDGLGRNIVVETPKRKVDGRDVVLSLDRNIQYIAYSELRRAVRHHGAASGRLLVLDVKHNKVLSMVGYPTYNPNARRVMPPAAVRNRVMTDVFEPGSVLKPFIVAAALEAGGDFRACAD